MPILTDDYEYGWESESDGLAPARGIINGLMIMLALACIVGGLLMAKGGW